MGVQDCDMRATKKRNCSPPPPSLSEQHAYAEAKPKRISPQREPPWSFESTISRKEATICGYKLTRFRAEA